MSSTENKLVRDEPATDSKVHNLSSILEASDESLSSTLTSFEAPGTPSTPAVPENRQHNQKIQYTPAVEKHIGTPAAVKRIDTPAVQTLHKAREEFHVQSPSDAALSPCTQKLFGPSRIKAPSKSQPLSVLRSKQQADVAKFNNGEPLDD